MKNWEIEYDGKFDRLFKRYEKNHPNELLAVIDNFDTYCETLNQVKSPLNVKAGFIHKEPEGIIAIDQKGGVKENKNLDRQDCIYLFILRKRFYMS